MLTLKSHLILLEHGPLIFRNVHSTRCVPAATIHELEAPIPEPALEHGDLTYIGLQLTLASPPIRQQ